MGTSFPQEYTPFLTHVVRSPLLCSILVKSTQEHPLAGEHPAEPSQALPIPPAVTHINTLSTLSHLGCFRSQWKKIDSAPVSSPNTPTPGLVLFFTTCFGGSSAKHPPSSLTPQNATTRASPLTSCWI